MDRKLSSPALIGLALYSLVLAFNSIGIIGLLSKARTQDDHFLLISAVGAIAIMFLLYSFPFIKSFYSSKDIYAKLALIVVGLFIGWWISVLVNAILSPILLIVNAFIPFAYTGFLLLALYLLWRAVRTMKQSNG